MADDETRAAQAAFVAALLKGGLLPNEAVEIVCSEGGWQGWLYGERPSD